MKKAISFLLAMVMILGIVPGVQAADVDVTTGLILHYSFNENLADYGIIMDMAGSNSPTIINNEQAGSYLQTVDGVAYFPGYSIKDGRTQLGAALKLPSDFNRGITDFTYSVWLMYDNYSDPYYNVGYTRLFDFGNVGSGSNNPRNSIFARFETEENVIRIQDRGIAGGSDDSASYVEHYFNKDIMTDWMLFTFTMEKNEATGYYESKVYIDGEEIPELSSTDKFTRSLDDLGEMNNSSNGMYIGRTVWGATNQYIEDNPDFCGQMDDVRIYDRAITKEQIAYLYENTKPETGKLNLVKSYNVDSVTTVEGAAPALPQYADYTISFQADEQREKITWDAVDESLYSTAGSFTVQGTTALGDVMTTVEVIKENDAAEDGLLLYYNFEEDKANPTEIIDASGNGNNAEVLNTVRGNVNNSLTVTNGVAKFPGMTSSTLGAALKLPNTINQNVTSFTYSAWIKADSSYEHANKLTRFFDFGNIDDGPRNSIFTRYTTTSGLMYIQDRYTQKSKETTLSNTPFTDTWGFFTFVYEKNESTGYYELTVYVNGEEVEALKSLTRFTRSLSDLGKMDDSSNGMFIGRTVWAATGNYVTDNPDFCGEMDEIRLYNRALTKDEVVNLFETTNPVGEVKAVDYSVEDVTTNAGDYPILPEDVTVFYNTGESKQESVTWETISSEKYSQAGNFEVNGVTESGFAVSVKIIVIKVDSSSTLNEGLVVYYNFDNESAEPDEILDVSGNGNNATVLKTVQTVTTNSYAGTTEEVNNVITVEDGVATFPGYTQLQVQSGWGGMQTRTYLGAALRMPSNVNNGIENFTYSAWIQVDTDYEFASGLQRFFDFGNLSNSYNSIFYRYVPTSGDSRFQDRYVGSSGDDASCYVNATLSDKPFNDKWAHLVITYEKQAAGYYIPTVYINGEEREEYNKSIKTLTRSLKDLGSLDDSTNALLIGRTIWAANNSSVTTNPDFKGKMDEIRLYNRVLLDSEIQQLYSMNKPSDVKVELDEYKIPIAEDVEVTRDVPAENLNGSSLITVASGNYDTYTHFGLMRTGELSDTQKLSLQTSDKILLSMYMLLPDGTETSKYYCYGLSDEYNSWDVDNITYGNYVEHIYGSVMNDGTSDSGELIGTYSSAGGIESYFIQFDVTEFVKANIDDFSFLITTDSEGGSIVASELVGGYVPELIAYVKGMPIEVNRVDTDGNHISSSVVFGNMGESYTYTVADSLISHNGAIYAVDEEKSKLTIDEVTGDDKIEVVYALAENVTASVSDIRTYVGEAPDLPSVIEVQYGAYSATFAAEWDDIDKVGYAQTGTFTAEGVIAGTNVPISANVTVFPEYNGALGGDLTLYIYADGELYEEKTIQKAYGATFTLDKTYEQYLGNCYRLEKVTGDITAIGGRIVMNQLNQSVNLYFVMTEEIQGTLSVKIKADNADETSYTLTVTATVINTKLTDEKVSVIIADYNSDTLAAAETVSEVIKSRTGEYITITKSMPYVKERDEDKVIYLWGENMLPLAGAVKLADVKTESFLPEDAAAMVPTYDSAVSTVKKANDYWQSRYAYNQSTNGLDVAFWDTAAYHTGNIEAYKLTGDESYLDYSVNWANYCDWMGNDYQGEPSTWTWDYNQTQGSNAVLFGDWQTCFQSFIDLYDMGVEDANLDRVYEVIDYQISTDRDNYWWWADALYMVMPVMSKLYKLTGDEAYLDALYKYFKYAKEYMYDGPGGIPENSDGYTTSAKLKSGASYADPDNYAYLFYRDSNYVYPLRPNAGHEDEKNFWARGNGWVFAALAKVLADMPSTYEHYDEFYTTYMEMAQAIIACQETDDNGYGFWTQSMLQGYPTSSDNPYGYETSGTAFMTYGLLWGINNGLLDEEIYLEPTIRAWGYLENVAMQDSGKVGYVQPIGSNATSATPYDRTVNFGVGAFLLAGCEAARYAELHE